MSNSHDKRNKITEEPIVKLTTSFNSIHELGIKFTNLIFLQRTHKYQSDKITERQKFNDID